MIEDIFSFLSSSLSGNFAIALTASFSWGILSVLLSPCHLSSIPLIVGYINSQGVISLNRTFKISLVFALGILITISIIGLITASLGRLLGDIGSTGNYIVAVVFFIVGLYLLDILKLPGNKSFVRGTKHTGLLASLTLGLLFGIGLGPCTFAFMAPVLGVVFQVAKINLHYAISLLLFFGLGHIAVIISAGTLSKQVQKYLNWTEKSGINRNIKRICGLLVIAGGIYFIYNIN